jgi:thiol-disulfide isomerase/thioredoxin
MRAWAVGLVMMTSGVSALAADAKPPGPPVIVNTNPGWLGVEMSSALDGIRVVHVIRTSPAEKAGVRDDDRIVKVDGVSVSTPEDVTRVVGAHHASDVVELTLKHDDTLRTARVTLSGRPTSDDIAKMEYVGTFAPAFAQLLAVSGTLPNVQAYRGRVVVLEFWATWCGPCRMTTPILAGWQAKYGAQGLTVVGVTTDPVERASLYVQENDMRYTVASDPGGFTSQSYRVRSIPSMFVIDKRGVIRDVSIGFDPNGSGALEREIAALLAEPAPPAATAPGK